MSDETRIDSAAPETGPTAPEASPATVPSQNPTTPPPATLAPPQPLTVPTAAPLPTEQTSPAPAAPGGAQNTTPALPESTAGEQFGERPAPIPAEGADFNPRPPSGGPVLPRTDTKEIQPAPVITGAHRVELDLAAPDPGAAAQTAPANRTAAIGTGGLTELARLVYGDENRAVDIFAANRDRMVSPDAWTVGQIVRIPD